MRGATEDEDLHKLTNGISDCILCQPKQCQLQISGGSSSAVNFLFSLNLLIDCRLSFTFTVLCFLLAWLSFTCTFCSSSWPALALHQHFCLKHIMRGYLWPTRFALCHVWFCVNFGLFGCWRLQHSLPVRHQSMSSTVDLPFLL